MRSSILLLMLLVGIVGLENLQAQEDLTEAEQKKIEEEYFGNKDFWKAGLEKDTGSIEKARILYKKAAIDFEKATKWEAFLDCKAELADTYKATPDFQKGLDIIAETILKSERDIPKKEQFCFKLYYIQSSIYAWERQPNIAKEINLKAFKKLEKTLPLDAHEHFALSYNALSVNYRDLELLDSAIYYSNKTLATCKNLSAEFNYLAGFAHRDLGNLTSKKGDYKAGITHLNKSIEIITAERGEFAPDLFAIYFQLGRAYKNLGENEEAIRQYKKAVFVLEGSDKNIDELINFGLPVAYITLGRAYLKLGKLEEAETYGQKTINLLEGNPHQLYYYINTLNFLGAIAYKKQLLDDSMNYYAKADSLTSANVDTENPIMYYRNTMITTKSGLALAATAKGNYQLAKNLYFQLLQKPYGPKRPLDLIDVNDNLQEVYLLENRLDSAFIFNQAALVAACQNFEASDDYFALPQATDIGNFNTVYDILLDRLQILNQHHLQDANFTTQQHSKAIDQLLNLADNWHNQNIQKINFLRGSRSEAIVQKSIPLFQKGIQTTANQYINQANQEALAQAFYFTQKMKSQQLWLSLLKAEASHFGQINPDLLNSEKQILEEITQLENELLKAQKEEATARINEIENKELYAAKNKLSAIQKTLELEYPSYVEAKYNFQATNTTTIQELIDDGELVLEYVLLDSTMLLFSITKDQAPTLKKVPLDDQLLSQIQDYRSLLAKSSMIRSTSRQKHIQLSHTLYQQFIQPIENQLVSKEKLIIIGDGITNYIPFETLLASNEIKPFDELNYLIKNHEVSYHYSSTLFVKSRQKAASNHQGIFAFAPVYDNYGTAVTTLRKNDNLQIDSTLRAYDADGYFSPLPESEREAKSILKLFDKKSNTSLNTLSLRDAATEFALKTNLEKAYRYIHIAGHSFADIDNPKFSGIACYQEMTIDSTITEDGTLFTGEIYNISSQADLVTLSSCESGFGKLEKTEGLLGLNRAFIYAGTPNVVFSLWKVYDKVSAELMVDFYKNVLEGKDYSESLHAAKLELLEDNKTASPHFWSPFLLIGR